MSITTDISPIDLEEFERFLRLTVADNDRVREMNVTLQRIAWCVIHRNWDEVTASRYAQAAILNLLLWSTNVVPKEEYVNCLAKDLLATHSDIFNTLV